MDPVELRRRVGYVPQDGGLLPHWRVGRNVALVPWLRGMSDAAGAGRAALALVGLEPEAMCGERWPRELSGGQRQRVAVARALAARARTWCCSTSRSARWTRSPAPTCRGRCSSSAASSASPPLLVTHDLPKPFLLADRIAVMRRGRDRAGGDGGRAARTPATEYVRALLARARVTP